MSVAQKQYKQYLPSGFKPTSDENRRCGKCLYFPSIDNGCQKVRGYGNRYLIGYVLSPLEHVCDRWKYGFDVRKR